MPIKAVLFDLDGTLLPMDQDVFIKAYMGGLTRKAAAHGYDPGQVPAAIWAGTGAMVKNKGDISNEDMFWDTFSALCGKDARQDIAIFDAFYRNEFQEVRHVCGFDPRATEAIREIRALGYRVALATNPLFPAIATRQRIRWAGLKTEDFELVTTYENSRRCKPNPDYYRDVLAELGVEPENCIMVGNDVEEDILPARGLGMKTFLLNHSLLNRKERSLEGMEQGGFAELKEFLLKHL